MKSYVSGNIPLADPETLISKIDEALRSYEVIEFPNNGGGLKVFPTALLKKSTYTIYDY